MTLDITQNDANVVNDTVLRDAPAVRITGSRVRFTNRNAAKVESTADGVAAIEIVGIDGTIVNDAGAAISGIGIFGPGSVAIRGSAGGDRIENAGRIGGLVSLGDGADAVVNAGMIAGDVDLGAGDDLYVEIGQDAMQGATAGGAGTDTYRLRGDIGFTNGTAISGFERLEIEGRIAEMSGFSGFASVRLAAGAGAAMFDGRNGDGDLFLGAGSTARLLSGTVFRDVSGSEGGERLDLFNRARVEGSVDLGAGDDVLGYAFDPSGSDTMPFVGGAANGGAGRDRLELSVGGGRTVDLSRFTGFEILNAGTFTSATSDVRLTGLNGFAGVEADNGGRLIIGDTNASGLTVTPADGASLTIEAGVTIGAIDYLPNGMNFDRGTVTQARDTTSTVVNNGAVVGDAKLTTGRDTYDGRGGSVGGAVFGYAGDDALTGGAGADRLDGGFGNDALTGGDGDDALTGGEGDDVLTGGRGRDRLDGGAGSDTADYAREAGAAGVIVNLGTAFLNAPGLTSSVGPNEAQDSFGDRDTLANIENVRTGAGADTVVGSAGANVVEAGAGDDVVRGGAGDDRLVGGDGNDQLSGEAGNDTLEGGAGNDLLLPGLVAGTERAFGGAGDDLLSAGFGAADSAVVMTGDFAADPDGGVSGEIAGASGNSRVVFTSVERFSIGGSRFDDVLVGNAGVDVLSGADGNDVLAGRGGNDTLSGGRGDDRLDGGEGSDVLAGDDGADVLDGGAGRDLAEYSRETGPTGVVVNLSDAPFTASPGSPGAGQTVGPREAVDSFGRRDALIGIEDARGGAFGDRLIGSEGANLLDGLADDDNLFGLGGNDDLRGGAGDDYLDGGLGDDVMTGGAGDDFYVVDSGGDIVVEGADGGNDFVYTSLTTYVLPVGVERLESVGDAGRDFRGNAGNNEVQLGIGDDFVRLQDGGDDSAEGDAGNDGFYFGGAFTAGDRVIGGEGSDQVGLQGVYAGLVLGAESLVGIETLVLLPGSDTRFADLGGARTAYAIATVDANVAAGTTLTVNMNTLRVGENVMFDGSAESDGTFLFYGGFGSDVLTGGAGSDAFFFGTGRFGAGDRVNGGSAGEDQLGLQGDYAGANALTLGAGQLVGIDTIVLLTGQDARFGGGGRSFSYDLTLSDGNAGAGGSLVVNGNTLRPDETMRVDGSAETDARLTIFAGSGADVLIGGGGADQIVGGAGGDAIRGGGGGDRLTGGAGDDRFVYGSTAESGGLSVDVVLDFARGDLFDLQLIDADRNSQGSNEAFRFIGDAAFSRQAGELRVVPGRPGEVGFVVEGDTDGDGTADFTIAVNTVDQTPLLASDFIL